MTTLGNQNRVRNAQYMELVGLSPTAFEVLVAVMAFERVFGEPAPSRDVRALLDVHDLELRELVSGQWLTVEGTSNARVSKRLSARPRAWNSLGVRRIA